MIQKLQLLIIFAVVVCHPLTVHCVLVVPSSVHFYHSVIWLLAEV